MKRAETAVWVVVGLALAAVVGFAAFARSGRTPTAPPPGAEPESAGVAPEKTSELLPEPAGDFGDVPCTERSGRDMRTSELKGRFVVADFVFTYCGGPCPRRSAALKALQDATPHAADLVLVTFTVDPDRDTPAELAKYADGLGASKDRWLFVRCPHPGLEDLAYDHLKLVKSREDLFSHSTMFVLADRQGRVRAYYSPLDDAQWMTKLLADLDRLRAEPAK